MRSSELGVVMVMVFVRASPNAAWAERQDAKESHHPLGHARMGQYRQVLLVVINHKKAQDEQPGENTADNPARQIEVPESPYNATQQ